MLGFGKASVCCNCLRVSWPPLPCQEKNKKNRPTFTLGCAARVCVCVCVLGCAARGSLCAITELNEEPYISPNSMFCDI